MPVVFRRQWLVSPACARVCGRLGTCKPLTLMRIMSLANGHNLVSIPLDEQYSRQPYASVTRQGLLSSLSAAVDACSLITRIIATISDIEHHADQVTVTDEDHNSYQADWVFGADGMMNAQYVDGGIRQLEASRYAYRFLLPLHQLPPVLLRRQPVSGWGRMANGALSTSRRTF